MFAKLTMLDITVVVICLALLGRGLWTGFVRQIAFIAALSVSYLAAGRYYGDLAPYFASFISEPRFGFALAYLVVLVAVYLAVMLAGVGLKKVMQVSFLGWFDRFLGGVFGLGKAVFLATLLFMFLSALLAESSPTLRTSVVTPYLDQSSRFLLRFVNDEGLRRDLLPKKPAIGPDLLLSLPKKMANGAELLAPLISPTEIPVEPGKPRGGDAAPKAKQYKLIEQSGAKRAI